MNSITQGIRNHAGLNITAALSVVTVEEPGMWENENGPADWYAVSTSDNGIVAYFPTAGQAYSYRLTLINNALNQY